MIVTQVSVYIMKEDNLFICYCPDLEVCASGKTIEESKKKLDQSIDSWIRCGVKNDILFQCLFNLGWRMSGDFLVGPRDNEPGDEYIEKYNKTVEFPGGDDAKV